MKPDKYHVLIAPSADRKLAAHIEFLARVSEKAAMRLYEAYEEAIEYIEGSPESCSPYITQIPTDNWLRFKMFFKRYRIVFEIISKNVYVYDIQDCRQDTDKNLI